MDPASLARKSWTRFVFIRADARDATSMWPRLGPGSLILLDRHYNTLRPYRKNDRNLYAVRKDDSLLVRYLELSGTTLVLRPHHPDEPIEILPIEEGKTASDLIAGRVAYISFET